MKQISIVVVAAFLSLGVPTVGLAASDMQPLQPCLINAAATFICSNGASGNATPNAGVLLGAVNNSLSAQTASVTCYANASGVASGIIVATIPPLAAGASYMFPGGGRTFPLGLACVPSAAPIAAAPGNGIEIYVYPGPR